MLTMMNWNLYCISLIKFDFQIIGITEHKISDLTSFSNISISDYHNFVDTPTKFTHGGTGFYVKNNVNFRRRVDLEITPPGPTDFESTFIEIIIPNNKNIVAGCIYRQKLSKNYLLKLKSAPLSDFYINLLNSETHSFFYNTMLSNFLLLTFFNLQDLFLNLLLITFFVDTIDLYPSKSGNLKFPLADHLLQFALLEDFFQPSFRKKHNIKERNLMRENSRKLLIALIYIMYFN